MKTWTVSQFRSMMREVLESVEHHGPQRLTRDEDCFILMREGDFARLTSAFPEIASLVLETGFAAEDMPMRGTTAPRRKVKP